MVKNDWKKTKTIYYSDYLNDDFEGGIVGKRPPVPKNYDYVIRNPFKKFISNLIYYGLAKPILSFFVFFNGVKVQNRAALKELRKLNTGVFLYGNHVAFSDAYKMQSFVIHRRVYIIGYTDALAINKVVTYLVKQLGHLPLPNDTDLRTLKKLSDSLDYFIKKRKHILIYPEAHVWPYYTKIRDFKNGSFHYPAKLNAPILPFVTVFRKVWWRKRPCQTIVFGKIVYPKKEFSVHENRDYLRNECLNQMKDLAEKHNKVEYIKYIYREK